jgi:myo-inositol-1-phosphate synthase
VKLERTYQLNTGGNTDFLNMLNRHRLKSKKKSKTEAVQSVAASRLENENIHIGPSDYVPWQKDNKICFIRMEGKLFGDVPMDLELRLSVEDSPNSAGVAIDAIRCAKLALDRGIGGVLEAPSAYFCKHPPRQFTDDEAFQMLKKFICDSSAGFGLVGEYHEPT